jgi:hypothetical protein
MANTFKRYTLDGITSKTNFHSAIASNTENVVIGLQVANVGASTATVHAYLYNGSADIYIAKSVPIPVGSTLSLLDGKIICTTADIVKLESDIAVDGILSVLEQAP